ncbi:hypothetical protein BpHYR1_022056, partial [Brachionus plicatilis]
RLRQSCVLGCGAALSNKGIREAIVYWEKKVLHCYHHDILSYYQNHEIKKLDSIKKITFSYFLTPIADVCFESLSLNHYLLLYKPNFLIISKFDHLNEYCKFKYKLNKNSSFFDELKLNKKGATKYAALCCRRILFNLYLSFTISK